jgi:AAA family ATP:ADP antiporter
VLLTINVFVLLTCYYVLEVVREPLILLGGGAELGAYAMTAEHAEPEAHRERAA